MSAALVLLLATAIVVPGALAVFVGDLRMGRDGATPHNRRSVRPATGRLRMLLESVLPLIGIMLLVWFAWVAL